MQAFIEFNEQRAQIYWWLSSLFAKELTEDDLSHYQTDLQPFLTALANTDELKPSVEALKSAIAAQALRQDGQLELAADFCGLFLADPKVGALPYASLYIGETGVLNDEPAQNMVKWLQEYNVASVEEFARVPQDHLSIQLDFMGNLIILGNQATTEETQEEALQTQWRFMQEQLSPWIDKFTQRCEKQDPFGFYAASAKLLANFIALDMAFLKGE